MYHKYVLTPNIINFMYLKNSLRDIGPFLVVFLLGYSLHCWGVRRTDYSGWDLFSYLYLYFHFHLYFWLFSCWVTHDMSPWWGFKYVFVFVFCLFLFVFVCFLVGLLIALLGGKENGLLWWGCPALRITSIH